MYIFTFNKRVDLAKNDLHEIVMIALIIIGEGGGGNCIEKRIIPRVSKSRDEPRHELFRARKTRKEKVVPIFFRYLSFLRFSSTILFVCSRILLFSSFLFSVGIFKFREKITFRKSAVSWPIFRALWRAFFIFVEETKKEEEEEERLMTRRNSELNRNYFFLFRHLVESNAFTPVQIFSKKCCT